MAQSFNCPNCSAPLDFDGEDVTVRCPYCNSSVIVPNQLNTSSFAAGRSPSLPVVGLDTLIGQANKLKEIVQLIKGGKRIEAINLYRDTFETSLGDAQAAIEKLSSGQSVVMPESSSAARTALERQLSRLLKAGNKIEAIKIYQTAYPQIGLKAAKAAIEKYDSSGMLDLPDSTVSVTESAGPVSGLSSDRVAAARADIARLMREGNKIEAIKVYRQVTGSGLKEAKDAVESFESGGVLAFDPTRAAFSAEADSEASRSLAQSEIERLARSGNTIEAIKLYREATDASLKEAKGAVEAFVAGRPLVLNRIAKPDVVFDRTQPKSISPSGFPILYQFLLFSGLTAILFIFLTIVVWPNQLRLGAPFLCPSGYDNAYGLKLNGFVELHCYIEPNRDVVAFTPFALAAVFVFYFLFGALVFGLLKYIRFAGFSLALIMILPLATLSFPLIGWVASAEAPRDMFLIGLLFADTDGVRVEPSFTEQLLTRFSYATPVLYIGADGVRPGYFKSLQAVAVDGEGNVYASDYLSDDSRYRVQVFDATGHFVKEWSAGRTSIDGIVADARGRLYAATGDGLIVYDGASGETIKNLDPEHLYRDVAWDGAGGLVAVTQNEIIWLDPNSGITRQSDTFGELIGDSLFVPQLAVGPDGNVYVTDDENYQVLIFNSQGQLLSKFGSRGDAVDQFESSPRAILVDAANQIFVTDGWSLKVFDVNGNYQKAIDLGSFPSKMFLNDSNTLWVVDGSGEQIVKFRVNR
jgi:ribosomal protein L7/L12/DNA-directed RNA polymerase subunit RPC12/RpoP